MLAFLSRNKQAAAMLGLLAVAALLVVGLTTKGGTHYSVRKPEPEPEDISHDPFVFSSYSLPTDNKFMPSIGNGHLATDVFSEAVYMNGLYNGRWGRSRRARIPAWANVRLNSTLTHHPYKPMYSLDTKNGVFVVKVERERSVVTQKIYAHRFYTRALINQIEVATKPHVDPNFVHHGIWISIKLMPGGDSDDVEFKEPSAEYIAGRYVWSSCGHTKISEDSEYQPQSKRVCAYWTSVPDHLVVPQHGSRVFTFAMTLDENRTVAKQEMING
ncbi:Protein-glucosylgalactosylhydroxylysine glucosidase [Eumeta japonica]|uniref:Protein-glucosylgalactosylhydroxylysine glucosidase n=1 Tax=Eumeta variegata TaxID=151549 RepID=A0A4C2A3Z3_EUMVA|nr:Protein-glucosylgalactosylhydroxylysine glucosidase [Eumeta japonica]